MKYAEFVERVQQLAQLDERLDAEWVIRVTLQTLSDHLSGGEVRDLKKELPRELATFLYKPGEEARAISLPEFFNRIRQRLGVSEEEARVLASAVMVVLREAISRKELQDIFAQLPLEYDLFFRMP
jgi:uncharacterized protein (DUF2267 family)